LTFSRVGKVIRSNLHLLWLQSEGIASVNRLSFFLVLFDKFTAGIPFSSSSSSSSSFHHLSLPPSSFLLPPSLEHPCASLSILKAALKAKESPRAPVPAAAARFAPRPLDGSTDRPAEGRLKAHRLPTADGIQVSAAGMIRSGTVFFGCFPRNWQLRR